MYGEGPELSFHPRGFLWALQLMILPSWAWRMLHPGVPRMFRCRRYQPPTCPWWATVPLPGVPLSTASIYQQLRSKGCPIPKSNS